MLFSKLFGPDNDEFLSPTWHNRKSNNDIINGGGLELAKLVTQRNCIPLNSYSKVDGAGDFTYVSRKGASVIVSILLCPS